MADHMDHPDLLPEFVELQDRFLGHMLYEYREHEIMEWLSSLTAEDLKGMASRDREFEENLVVIPFLYIRYRAIPRRDAIHFLRSCLDATKLIPNNNRVLVKTRANFDRIFRERSDYRYI